ncbi:hypothetical protein N7462_011022 [Penicillium macrosclerotiorum]|uniref:uncharacterized protein n=1 Tax=Penicillium macrosclerotiorum TaxID=303699 RepID=UPI002547BA51|nr:uncharacterized protein N7462_011022 [Penicillium macrosclerotiorum]KAJ5666613.1 hypothetical protein N7462_011022 [Penicillium macrosclerotiorum]
MDMAGFTRKQGGPSGSFRDLCIDCGTSAKIAKGQIKIKSGTCPVLYTDKGLQFDDGSHVDADVIIFATGFKFNMPVIVQEQFGPDIVRKANRLDTGGGQLKRNYLPTGRKYHLNLPSV